MAVSHHQVASEVKHGYINVTAMVDSQRNGTHLVQMLNFFHPWTAIERGGVNKARSSVWTVETACPLKCGQQSVILTPAYAYCIHAWCLFPWKLTAATILADAAVTRTVSEMTNNVSSGTLNHTLPNLRNRTICGGVVAIWIFDLMTLNTYHVLRYAVG